MLKQISMPTVMKTTNIESQLIASGIPDEVARHTRRRESFASRVQEAEHEMNTALGGGYTLITQYTVSTPLHEEIVFVLWKAGPL
jgi:hypothetical protein